MRISGSLRNKLIIAMLIAAVLPFGASLFISQQFTQERLADKAVKDNSNLLYQGKINMTNYLQTLQFMSSSIYNNAQLVDILKDRSGHPFTESELYGTEQVIRSALQNIDLSFADVQQVYLYAAQSDNSYLYNTLMIVNDKEDRPFRPSMSSEQQSEVLPPHGIEMYGKSFLQTSKPVVITYQHVLYDLFPKTELGVLAVDVSMETINQISAQLHTRGEEELFILDGSGKVIYAPDASQLGQALTDPWTVRLQEELERGSQNFFRLSEGEDEGVYIFETIHLAYLDWVIVKRIPDAILYRTERQLLQLNLATGLFFLIISVMVTIGVSIKMTSPISQLIGYINRIKLGQMDVDIQMNRNDELGILASRFKSMMHTINELVLKEYKLEVANKTNELKALQAQVNPHFLNNALQSIGALALQNGNRDVYTLISLLGKMMRYSMNTDEPMVMLKSEIDYINAFLRLQKQRFGNQFSVDIEYEPETELVQIPKMIIQPLIENYFKHGFMGGDAANRISVRCYMGPGENRLHIEVSDNGFGVSQEQLDLLRERLDHIESGSPEGDSGSIGLANVKLRLQLYYQQEARMILEHAEPQGLSITMIMPSSHNKGDNEDEHIDH